MSLEAAAERTAGAAEAVESGLLDQVDGALAAGLDLHRWWRATDAADAYRERFEVVSTFHRPDRSFAFFDEAPAGGRTVRVMGDVDDLFYDRPKSPGRPAEAADWMRRQVREFALRYFLRISDFRTPAAFTRYRPPTLAPLFRPFSWCPDDTPEYEGFGYKQLFYKRRGDGAVGAFPERGRHAIVDLREVGPTYDWIVLRIAIFAFDLTARPFGPGTPEVRVPLAEEQYVVMSPDFVIDEDDPEPGVLGRYGFGYAVLQNPGPPGKIAYGPGHFEVGFQTFTFEVLDSGETRLRLVFCVNRPERILDVSFNPLDWGRAAGEMLGLPWPSAAGGGGARRRPGFDPLLTAVGALNAFTDGQAGREFCITRTQLERDMLVQHFLQNYQLVTGSLQTWRQIGDWLDEASLPRWVIDGSG